jgi:acetyl esterase/lipase
MQLPFCQRRRFLRAALAGGSGLLAACSPLTLINSLAPAGTYRPARDLPYGPAPRHRLDVYQPEAAGAAAPVIVFFYGGNWDSGERADYLFAGEALASKGYVAVVPDYRLYPQVRFPDFLFDCAQAVRWVLDHCASWGGDPRRVFLMGHSAGAYNAAMLALNPRYLQSVDVAPSQLSGLVGLAGPYDFLPLIGNVTKAVFGFPDTPAYTQPINFAGAGAPPALLATGAADDVVDPGNSRRLAARLRANGVAVREIVYPKLGHRTLVGALAAPLRGLAPVLADVVAFVDACTADCRV